MNHDSLNFPTMKNIQRFYLASLSTMILTIIHHGYGALIYEEPFRLHVAFIAIPVILILIITNRIYQKNHSSISGIISRRILIIVSLLVPTGLIGMFEGGYNHLVKNILFFGGMAPSQLIQLFPPPKYEMPNNFLFEVTGTLQFFLGIYTLYYLLKFMKANSGKKMPLATGDMRH